MTHESTVIWRLRNIGGFEYQTCSNCGHEDEIQRPTRTELPYCGSCGKAVLDIAQNYCGWCGKSIQPIETGVSNE